MSALVRRLRPTREARGQALVEFSLAIIVFLVMVVGIFDLGRGVFAYNGVAEASREIARVTAVHPGDPVGTSAETVDRIAVQKALVPGMGTPAFACTDLYGSSLTLNGSDCGSGDFVKVTVTAPYRPMSLLGFGTTFNLASSSSVKIP